MTRLSFIFAVVLSVAVVSIRDNMCAALQPVGPVMQKGGRVSTQLQMGLFDGFVKSMESGYAGGEESPYAKKIAAEEAKRKEFEEKKRQQRKSRGFKEFKDYDPKTQKTFVKTKFDDSGNTAASGKKEAKAGFKFPWDK
mmetsp:Transcript_61071/g.149517  ORF Transcript_61071/g.149517 Transcript_61071/m.149517 type:complete len:139 (+) Transcript_61071:132-548(+)